jgi:hypothetical protein
MGRWMKWKVESGEIANENTGDCREVAMVIG